MAIELRLKEFSALPVADDGKTLLYTDGEVKQSSKNLSEMLTDEINNKLDTTAFSTVSGSFLTAHQVIPSGKWENASDVVISNSATWGSGTDWTDKINAASANAYEQSLTQIDLKMDKSFSSNFYPRNENPNGYLTEHQDLSNYATKTYVNEEVGKVGSYVTATRVNDEPDVQNPSNKKIYLTKDDTVTGTDLYKEWIYTESSAWECIGDTSIDLSDYATISQLNTKEDKLRFGYNDNDAISSINGSALAVPEGGSSNSWKQWSEGNGSEGDNDSVYIGKSNSSYNDSYILGRDNYSDSGSYIVGNFNTASEAGYIIGDDNSAFKGCAAIGNHNFVNGHSIGLGWKNVTNDSSAAHSILFGFMNSAVNDRELLDSKNIKLQNIIHYSDELMQAAYNEYTAKSATLYQNSATTSFSCYDRWGDPVNASFYLIDYWYDDNSELGFNILFPVEAGFNSASWNSYDNSKYFYVSNSYSSTLQTKYYNHEISYDFYSKIRYISNYSTLTSTKSQINSYWNEDRTQQYYNYTAASANYYEKVRTNNTYESATSSVKPATNSFIVGTNNSAAHYNSYLFGSYNQSLTYNNTSSNDDGFVFAMGFNNMVSRNYDMAIGYGSIASGGENIAIGTPHYSYNNNEAPYAAAIGYKNIAFNAYVEGIMNIAYDSIITIPFSDWRYGNNKFHSVKANTWTYTPSLNFHNNYFDFVNGCTIDVGKNFNCNVMNQMSGTTLLTDEHFDFNELFMIDRANISSRETSRNTMKYFRESKIYTNQIFGNILYNLGSGTDLSAAAVTENIFFNEGGSTGNSNDPRNRIALTANKLGQNFIFNTSLMGSATEGAGINQNFLINSHISANHNYLQYGIDFGYDTIGHSFIYGTDISGQASETFSFAASYDSTGTSKKAVLSRVSKITNFGDNVIKNSYDSFVYGDTNTVTSVGNSFIEGRLNLVQGPRNGNAVANGSCTMYNHVFGNVNVISNSTTATASRLINSVIIGDGNGIIRDSSNAYNYVTHNTIMGYVNGIMSVPETTVTNAINCGMYNWVINNGNVYQNILRYTSNEFISSGGELLNFYGNNASYNNARNNIIGSHSIISDNVNDSTLIGSFNVAYCNQLQTFNTMTANYEPWTSKSYSKSACVVYNGSAFSSTINNNTYTPTNASYWSRITYTEGSSYNTLSNNYVMGSFNLSENGSNQVILGNSNIASGHNSISIGEGLIADASQTVFGRYNVAMEGTNGISADYVNSKSGVLLIVGNGRHINDKTDIDSIERSNAMTVSANGVVSAADYITSGGYKLSDISAVLELLNNKPTDGQQYMIGLDANGNLTWLSV